METSAPFLFYKGNFVRYVYLLKCPLDGGIVRYVGQTYNVNVRFKQHISCRGFNLHKNSWIRKLKEQNLIPIVETVCEGDFKYINQQEKILIAHYREIVGNKLTNLTHGGEEEILTEEGLKKKRQGILNTKSPFKTLEDVESLFHDILAGKPMAQIMSERNCQKGNIGNIVRGVTHKYFSDQIKPLQQDVLTYCKENKLSIGGTGGARFVPKHHLRDDIIYQIFDLYVNKGLTSYEIGKEIHATSTHVLYILNGKFRKNLLEHWLQEGNEPPNTEREYESLWTAEEWLKAFDLRKQGLSSEQIANQLDCNRDYLTSVFRGACLPHIKKQWESLNGEYVPPKSHNYHICANPDCGKEFFEYHKNAYCSRKCFARHNAYKKNLAFQEWFKNKQAMEAAQNNTPQ